MSAQGVHDGVVSLVETMTAADSLRLTDDGPDGDEIRIVGALPKAKTPLVPLTADNYRLKRATTGQI